MTARIYQIADYRPKQSGITVTVHKPEPASGEFRRDALKPGTREYASAQASALRSLRRALEAGL